MSGRSRSLSGLRFWTSTDDPGRLEAFSSFPGSPCERGGLFVMRQLIEPACLQAVRNAVLRLLAAVEQQALGRAQPGAARDFQEQTEARLRRLLGARPALRPPLMQALRRLPVVQGLSSHPRLMDAMRAIGMACPVERVSSLQAFLPWEEIFRERPHQDFGDMLSERSWTLQIPLHDIIKEETGAAEIYPGTYRLGPLTHHLIQDPDNGLWYESTDERWWKGRALKSFDTRAGDVVFFRCLNIHQTYPAQRRIRWSMVIRYDDATEAPILQTGANPFDRLRAYDFKIWTDQLQAFFKDYRVVGGSASRGTSSPPRQAGAPARSPARARSRCAARAGLEVAR